MLFFCEQTDWHAAGPCKPLGINSIESWLLLLVSHMIWTITLIQVTALAIAVVRQTSRVLAEMNRGGSGARLAQSRSESHLNLLAAGFEEPSTEEPDEPSW